MTELTFVKMLKFTVVFLCISFYLPKVCGAVDFIDQFISTARNITRVRTTEMYYRRRNELVVLDFIGLVEQYSGYTAEEYDVQTKDGYILKLHRISGSPFSSKAPGKRVVFIQHGLVGSSDFFVILGPDRSLAFQLADEGYDVWLGNARGNSYSKRHIIYSSSANNFKFWNFSMDEVGTIDIPAFIDVVLEITKKKKLTYIGYSMGTTVAFILLSSKPEYNDKMNLVIQIAPVFYSIPPYSPMVNTLKTVFPLIKSFAYTNQMYQLLPQSKLVQITGNALCTTDSLKQLCRDVFSSIINPNNLNFTTLPVLFTYMPAGTSINTVDHYIQLWATGKIQKYQVGFNNELKLKPEFTQDYDLSKVTSPHILVYSKTDAFSSLKDVAILKRNLPNIVALERAPDGYNHFDFLWADNVEHVIFKKLLSYIASFVK